VPQLAPPLAPPLVTAVAPRLPPPPPSQPPPSPPLLTGVGFDLTLQGDLTDYNETRVKEGLSTALEVEEQFINLTVVSASVKIEVLVTTPSQEMAVRVAERLANATASNGTNGTNGVPESTLSELIGTTVEAVTQAVVFTMAPPSAPPTPPVPPPLHPPASPPPSLPPAMPPPPSASPQTPPPQTPQSQQTPPRPPGPQLPPTSTPLQPQPSVRDDVLTTGHIVAVVLLGVAALCAVVVAPYVIRSNATLRNLLLNIYNANIALIIVYSLIFGWGIVSTIAAAADVENADLQFQTASFATVAPVVHFGLSFGGRAFVTNVEPYPVLPMLYGGLDIILFLATLTLPIFLLDVVRTFYVVLGGAFVVVGVMAFQMFKIGSIIYDIFRGARDDATGQPLFSRRKRRRNWTASLFAAQETTQLDSRSFRGARDDATGHLLGA